MIPEHRLDRAERLLLLIIKAGYRARQQSRAQDEKINILIDAQIKTDEQQKRFQGDLDRLEANQESLQASLKANQESLQASLKDFLDSLLKGRNGKSSN